MLQVDDYLNSMNEIDYDKAILEIEKSISKLKIQEAILDVKY